MMHLLSKYLSGKYFLYSPLLVFKCERMDWARFAKYFVIGSIFTVSFVYKYEINDLQSFQVIKFLLFNYSQLDFGTIWCPV